MIKCKEDLVEHFYDLLGDNGLFDVCNYRSLDEHKTDFIALMLEELSKYYVLDQMNVLK